MSIVRLLLALTSMAAAPAIADAPLAPAPVTICSLKASACAIRTPNGRSAVIWRKGPRGTRLSAWSASIRSPALQVSDDARSLVEVYPGLNLLAPDAGPETVVLVFHRPGSEPICVRLRDVIARPSSLPTTVSHRQWARAYGFDGTGGFVLMTAEGRSIRFDPSTGRPR